MRRLFGARRHAALLFSVMALAVSAGGVTYAAATIGSRDIIDNSIKSVDLKDGAAVKGVDVVDGTLTGADVADGTLTGADVADGTLTGADVADGTLTGADVVESTLAGVAHAILWETAASNTTAWTPLLTLGGLGFDARCRLSGSDTHLELRKRGPFVEVEQIITQVVVDQPPESGPVTLTRSRPLPSGAADLIDATGPSGYYTRDIGTEFIHEITVMTFQFNSIALANGGNACTVQGTITLGV